MSNASPRYCPLDDIAFIEVAGKDARSFLHAQLSLDIPAPPWDRAPLAGWHDARGRLRALVRIVPRAKDWLLMTPRDIGADAVGKLRMFVLRSDVALSLAEDVTALAVIGDADDWLASHGVSLANRANTSVDVDGVHWVRIGPALLHLIGPARRVAGLVDGMEPAQPELAELAEIELGIPSITAGLAERFVPQMLNLERLGGISFDKGCYPGQEVIARIHNLGSVKRRMRRFAVQPNSAKQAGSEIHDAQGNAVGEVIRAATTDDRAELLAVVQLDACSRPLYIDGQQLTELPLPYEQRDSSP